jgi:phosphoribosylaminoimidazole carboxylase (NCAIR synthetase)
MNLQNSGAVCREKAYVRHRPRRRTIQYSETPAMESRTRGVLDTRLRGYDGSGEWIIAMKVAIQPGYCEEYGYKSRFAHINH